MHDLRGFERHTESMKVVRIVGAVFAVTIFALLAAFAYEQGLLAAPPRQMVTDQELPSPSPPAIPLRI